MHGCHRAHQPEQDLLLLLAAPFGAAGEPVVLVGVAIGLLVLLAAALRRRPAPWEMVVLVALAGMSVEARRLYRRLLILAQARGLGSQTIRRAAAQAQAHFEN